MAKTKKDAASEYLKKVLALVPEGDRAAVEKALASDTVLETVGGDLLSAQELASQAETKLKETLEYRGTLDSWKAEQDAALAEERKKIAAAVQTPAGEPAKIDLTPYVTKEDLAKVAAGAQTKAEEQSLRLVSVITKLSNQHFADYGKPLDTDDLIARARKSNKDVVQAYQELSAPDREAKATKDKAAERSALEKEIRDKIMAERGHGVYPVPNQEPQGGGLAGFSMKKEEFGTGAALQELNKMLAEKGPGLVN